MKRAFKIRTIFGNYVALNYELVKLIPNMLVFYLRNILHVNISVKAGTLCQFIKSQGEYRRANDPPSKRSFMQGRQ